jgi:hypothetical protein
LSIDREKRSPQGLLLYRGKKKMTVFRVHKNENYTVLSNYHFKEKEMSLKAKGLLSLMLSLPDAWDYSAAGLVKLSKDGKDSVNGALKELETFGYLKRSQAFSTNGTFSGYNYEIYEQPNTDIKTEKPKTKKPFTGKPYAEKPSTENPQQLNIKELNKKQLNNKLIKDEEERKKDNSRPTTYDAIINGKIFNDNVKKALYEFIKMRKLIKKPLTDFALEKLIEKLFKLTYDENTQIEILENSILNNWQDIYKPKSKKKETAPAETPDNVTPLFDTEIDEDDVLKYFNDVVMLSENQVGKLINIMGLEIFDVYIAKLSTFIKENGNIKSHYATILKWYKEDTKIAR